MRLAVIPARGGSKRIPRKNIKDFCGKPIIAWSIIAARESGCFDRIIVSTDDEEIANVSLEWGAEVPFMRPEELADDYVGTAAVVRHAIEWFLEQNIEFEQICCIYATAPFVTAADLRRGLNILIDGSGDYVISVTSYSYPIQRAVRITREGYLEMFQPEHFKKRSQDLEEAYHDAGQFYWGFPETWKVGNSLLKHKATPIIIPPYRVQDIDTQEDWVRAELMFKLLKNMQNG